MENKKEEEFIPKTKHKALKIILAIVLIGLLMAGGYYIYKAKFDNPTKTVISIMEDTKKEINKAFDKQTIDKYKINGLVKIEANLTNELKDLTELLKNIDLQFNGEIDTNNNLGTVTINTKYKKEQLIDINTYYENNTAYVLLNGLYDKYLKVTSDDMPVSKTPEINITKNDIKILINSLIDASKKAMEELKFDRIGTSITIDGKEIDVYNNYSILDENGIKKILKTITSSLAKDNEFTKVYEKISGNKEDFASNMENYFDKLELPGTYKISYYTTKDLFNPKFVSERLEITNNGIVSSYNYDKINDEEEIIAINDNGLSLSCHIKKNDSIFNMSLTVNALGMSGKLDINTNFEKIKEITKPDISNSKKMDELTEQEEKEIEEKLQKNKGMLEFIQDISKLDALKG